MKLPKLNLKSKLILYIGVLVFSALTGLVYLIMANVREAIEEKTNQQIVAQCESYGNKLGAEMTSNLLFLKNLSAQLSDMRAMGRERVNFLLKSIIEANPGYNGIYIMYEPNAFDGKDASFKGNNFSGSNSKGVFEPYWQRVNGGIVSKIVDTDESQQPYYAIPRDTKKGAVIEPYLDQGLLMTSYVYPILENGKFVGIVGLDIAIADIDKFVSSASLLTTGYFSVMSQSGIIVADKYKEKLGEVTIKQVSENIKQPQLAGVLKDGQGKSVVVDYFDSRSNKDTRVYATKYGIGEWSVLAYIPRDEIFAAVDSSTHRILIFGLFIIAIAIVVAIFIASRISKPINELAHAANLIEKNDFSVKLKIDTGDELQHLGETFNKMASNLESSFNDIKEKTLIAEQSADEAERLKNEAQVQSDYLSESINRILVEMDKLAKGDLTAKLPIEGSDSISQLSKGFNSRLTI